MMGRLHFSLKKGNYNSLFNLDVKHLNYSLDFLIFLYYNYIVKKKGVESMKENRNVTFNHGFFCQMLRAASDFDLANALNDVKKEQERRCEEQCNAYAENIMNAIREAVEAGFIVSFFSDCEDNNNDYPDYSIHNNCLSFTSICVEPED